MTPAQVIPLVLFTVQFFLWHVGLYTAPVALSLAHILCSSPICSAHSKHYNIFLFKIYFFIGFTLKPAILSNTDTVMTTLHFCLFCLFCSHEHLSLLLSSHGCFHVPCFFLEHFQVVVWAAPFFCFFTQHVSLWQWSDRCGGSDLTGQALPLGWGGTCYLVPLIQSQFTMVGIKSQKIRSVSALASLPKQVLRDIFDTVDVCNESDQSFGLLKEVFGALIL